MAKKQIPLLKKAASAYVSFVKGLKRLAAGSPLQASGPVSITIPDPLPDDGTLPFTVVGTDAAGNVVALDPTNVTLTIVSDTPSVVTVGPITGLSSTLLAATSPPPSIGATATVTVTATFTANPPAGSPFVFTWPQTIVAGAITGIAVQPGTPTG